MSRTMIVFGVSTVGTIAYLSVIGAPTHVAVPLIAGLLVYGAGLAWWRFGRNAARVVRAGERARRKHGVASTLDVIRYGSAWAVRRKARIVRPSVAALGWVSRLRLPTSQVGVRLCRVGWLLAVWCSVEDAVLVLGGPRKGKTGLLACWILKAAGAVISTSTRPADVAVTAARRARIGPVYIYNPGGLGGIESTLAFDPLDGCDDPQVATATATDMIPAATGEGERWDEQARRTLAVLLYAAALGELGIGVVSEWVADPTNEEYRTEIYGALRRSPNPSPHIEAARQFLTNNDRTRSSITTSIMPALAWLTVDTATASLTAGPTSEPGVDRVQLSVARLLDERGTVYLLGRHEAHTAGLLAALTGRIIRQARNLAAYQPGGRLDPPLTLALDEAGRIAPIPLPDISGDCGGTGILLLAVFQSLADVIDRWGTTGASRLLTNCGIRVLFGGSASPEELKGWAELADQRDELARNFDAGGRQSGHGTRKVPVFSTALLANPGSRRVIVFHRDMPPIIGKVTMAWRRREYRDTLGWRILGRRISQWRSNVTPASTSLAHVSPTGLPSSPSVSPSSPTPRPADDPLAARGDA